SFSPGKSFSLLLLLAACGSHAPATNAGDGFTLAVSPASLTLPPLATATATVTAQRAGSVSGMIEIALDGLPDGVTVDAPAIAPGATSTVLTFHNQRRSNPVSQAVVAVRGSTGGKSASATFDVTVQCPATQPSFLSVLAGAAGGSGNADDTGQDARFNLPISLAEDSAGNLYVADTFNNVIRKFDVSTGAVTTVAGSPARESGSTDGTGSEALFDRPFGIAAG